MNGGRGRRTASRRLLPTGEEVRLLGASACAAFLDTLAIYRLQKHRNITLAVGTFAALSVIVSGPLLDQLDQVAGPQTGKGLEVAELRPRAMSPWQRAATFEQQQMSPRDWDVPGRTDQNTPRG